MEQTVLAFIQKHNMLAEGDNVIVALSGGADSMALFHFMVHTGAAALGVNVAAAHFNHGLRGAESDRDADFVAETCAQQGIVLYTGAGNMQNSDRPPSMSTEEWARRLRYSFFAGLAKTHNAKIATAHNRDDNAETVLFNLCRGAGPRGLSGIPPVRRSLVRPLLEVPRSEIEAYCKAKGLDWVTDSTNLLADFARNRLRLMVMPELEKVHHGASAAIARQSADMRELEGWLAESAHELLQSAAGEGALDKAKQACSTECGTGGHLLKLAEHGFAAGQLRGAPQPVRLKAMALLAGRHATRENLARMEDVLDGRIKATQVRGERRALLRKGRFVVEPQVPQMAADGELPLQEGRVHLPGAPVLRVEIWPIGEYRAQIAQSLEKSVKKGLNFAADYDKITECGVFRTRRPGDRFSFAGRGVSKTLKKWMNEEGMAPGEKATLPLLANGSQVLWLHGVGFADGLQVGAATKRVLVIHSESEEE